MPHAVLNGAATLFTVTCFVFQTSRGRPSVAAGVCRSRGIGHAQRLRLRPLRLALGVTHVLGHAESHLLVLGDVFGEPP